MWFNKIMLLFFCLVWSSQVWALTTDRDQPISIVSDRATIDDANKIAMYEGNVVVTQGTIRIDADKVTLNYTDKQSIEKVVAEGKPARFKQTPDGSKEDYKAKALRMEYNAGENKLYLTKDAELRQGDDTFTGPHITYNTNTGIITADKGNSKERVTVTITPPPSPPLPPSSPKSPKGKEK
jgi:lipopolysaccharide export system protein LptA